MYRLAWKMAVLNLWRRRVRSLMVVGMIFFSLGGLLSLQGLYDGMMAQVVDNSIRSESGEIAMFAPGYRLHKKLKYHMDAEGLAQTLEATEGVRAYSMRLEQEGLLATAHKSLGAKLSGIDLAMERRFGGLDEFVVEGEYAWGEREDGVILGEGLARKMHVGVGSRVVFTATDAQGQIGSISFRVRALVRTGNPAIDDRSLMASLPKVGAFLGMTGTLTRVAVMADSRAEVPALAQRLKAHFPAFEVLRWDELYPMLLKMQEMTETFNAISYVIVFVVAALGILAVMLVSVMQRLREFGILMAIGMSYRSLRMQILFEAFVLGMIGFVAGAALGGAVLWYWSAEGLDLSAWKAGMEAFRMNAVVHAQVRPLYFAQAFAAVLVASVLSVVWPLRILKKINPVEIIGSLR